MGSEELQGLLQRLFRRRAVSNPPQAAGAVGFEERLEQKLKELEREINEVRGRINRLIFLVGAAVVERMIDTMVK